MRSILFSLAALVGASAMAQGSLSQLQKQAEIEHTIRTIDSAQAALSKMQAQRTMACRMAFGSETFCGCLGDRLPIAIDFYDYISATTKSKADNNYSALKPELRKAYDLALTTRDYCVREERQVQSMSNEFAPWKASQAASTPKP